MKFIALLCCLLAFPAFGALDTITLSKRNSVVLNRTVSGQSISMVQGKVFDLVKNLDEGEPIYLVLDTPGGSVTAGQLLIDSLKPYTVDNPIHTVTIFAASMGYQIAQNMGQRYVLPSGIYMSHRAYVRGMSGQLPGELNTQVDFIGEIIQNMEVHAAGRVGLSLEEYQLLIRDEYWAQGFKAVGGGHADSVVLAKCDKSLLGATWETFRTPFGRVSYKISNCPLIRYPIEIAVGENVEQQEEAYNYVHTMFNDKAEFFKRYLQGK